MTPETTSTTSDSVPVGPLVDERTAAADHGGRAVLSGRCLSGCTTVGSGAHTDDECHARRRRRAGDKRDTRIGTPLPVGLLGQCPTSGAPVRLGRRDPKRDRIAGYGDSPQSAHSPTARPGRLARSIEAPSSTKLKLNKECPSSRTPKVPSPCPNSRVRYRPGTGPTRHHRSAVPSAPRRRAAMCPICASGNTR